MGSIENILVTIGVGEYLFPSFEEFWLEGSCVNEDLKLSVIVNGSKIILPSDSYIIEGSGDIQFEFPGVVGESEFDVFVKLFLIFSTIELT